MKVGWLADAHDPPGGAELTQAEFRAAAPDGVEIIDCPPGEVVEGLDVYVIHNCVSYSYADIRKTLGCCVVKYMHDVWPNGDPDVKAHLLGTAMLIFCSPLQAERFGGTTDPIPPALDLRAFRPTRQQRRNPKRKGTCCVGAFMNPGKGGNLVAEWADRNEPVDVYGWGPYLPQGPNVSLCGPVDRQQMPTVLSKYERFVFLPTAIEPFGRCVVEAWAAGLEIVTNKLVGADYYIEEAPEKLEGAAADFWEIVCA
jgi:hypothetical protein